MKREQGWEIIRLTEKDRNLKKDRFSKKAPTKQQRPRVVVRVTLGAKHVGQDTLRIGRANTRESWSG